MTAARIMIVEDEALLATDIPHQLECQGYAVTGTADSSETALKLIGEDTPD